MDRTFEQVILDLSSTFTGLPGDAVDAEITRALESVVAALGTDRASLFQLRAGGGFHVTHFWARPGIVGVRPETTGAAHLPFLHRSIGAGRNIVLHRLPDDLPPDAIGDREYVRLTGMRSFLGVPIAVSGSYICALSTGTFREYHAWERQTVDRLRIVGQILANALHRRDSERRLDTQLEEIRALKDRLEAENVYLREEVRGGDEVTDLVGRSPAIRRVLDHLAQVAPTDSTVLLLGETGTGKELLARALHERSPRRARPFIKVNCAALPATLIESELLGHEKGAFTGAIATHPGRFELADGGTLFLDEIGELAVELQAKLLRVLQDGEVQRLGATRPRKVDVRLVSATNQDLDRALAEGRFRRDLYYRLSVFPIRVPPLRDRRDDIPLITWAFVQRHQAKLGRRIEAIPRAAMDALVAYPWPGNVRELHNVLERALILSRGPTLHLEDALGATTPHQPVPPTTARPAPGSTSFDDVARDHVVAVLEQSRWRINGPGGAAELLAVHPNTLRSRMKRLGISRPR